MARTRKIDEAVAEAGLGSETVADTPKAGHNSLGDKGAGYVERIENVNAAIEEEKSSYMLRCKDLRADIKEILIEAKNAGIAKGAVKAVVKARDLERKAEAIREDLEADQADTYDQIRLALGDLSDLPLGQHALAGAATLDSLTEQ